MPFNHESFLEWASSAQHRPRSTPMSYPERRRYLIVKRRDLARTCIRRWTPADPLSLVNRSRVDVFVSLEVIARLPSRWRIRLSIVWWIRHFRHPYLVHTVLFAADAAVDSWYEEIKLMNNFTDPSPSNFQEVGLLTFVVLDLNMIFIHSL